MDGFLEFDWLWVCLLGAYVLSIRESISLGGKSASSRTTVEGEGLISKEKTAVAAAKTGQLTTRTDANTGELTMAASHGITTGVRLDVYWDGGRRYGMTVGTVATNAVPIDGGAGDDLPANLTQITAMVPIEEALAIDGDEVLAIEYYATQHGTIVLADGSNNLAASAALLGQDGTQRSDVWCTYRNGTNPLAGDTVTKAFFSHGYSDGTADLRVQALTT